MVFNWHHRRHRYLESDPPQTMTDSDRHYHGDVTDVTDITKGPSLTVTDTVLKLNLSHCCVLRLLSVAEVNALGCFLNNFR
jgi:hypothetical protein